jgi:hypothetical protein
MNQSCTYSARESAKQISTALLDAAAALSIVMAQPELAVLFETISSVITFVVPPPNQPTEEEKIKKDMDESRQLKEEFDFDFMLSKMMSIHMNLKDTSNRLRHYDSRLAYDTGFRLFEDVTGALYDTLSKVQTAMDEELYLSQALVNMAGDVKQLPALKKRLQAVTSFFKMTDIVNIDKGMLLSAMADAVRDNTTMEAEVNNVEETMKKALTLNSTSLSLTSKTTLVHACQTCSTQHHFELKYKTARIKIHGLHMTVRTGTMANHG